MKHVQALWTEAIRCGLLLNEYHLKGTFIKWLRKSIQQSVWNYWAKNKSASLQILSGHTMSLASLQSCNGTLSSGPSSSKERTNACSCHACDIINVEYASSLECLVIGINDATLTQKQVLNILREIGGSTWPTIYSLDKTTAMLHVGYCRVWWKGPLTSNWPHISNPETFIRMRNQNFHNQPRGRLSNGLCRNHPVRNWGFSSPTGSRENEQNHFNGKFENSQQRGILDRLRPGPPQRHLTRTFNGRTDQVPKTSCWEPWDGFSIGSHLIHQLRCNNGWLNGFGRIPVCNSDRLTC